MIAERLDILLRGEGYQKFRVDLPGVFLYQKIEGTSAYVIPWIVYHEGSIAPALYERLLLSVEQKLYFNGCKEVSMLTLFLTENGCAVSEVVRTERGYWVIDQDLHRLMIYEDQPADFMGLRQKIESILFEKKEPLWKRIPLCTAFIVFLNVVIFLVMFILEPDMNLEHMMNWGAMHVVPIMRDHEYYRLITSIFLHFDFSHLLNNMLIIYFAGEQLEDGLGHVKFIVLYMLSGLSGNLLSLFVGVRTSSLAVSAGASGSGYGIIGGLFVFTLLNRNKGRTITTRRIVLLLAAGLYNGFASTGVDNMAHIGGAVGGMLIALCFCMINKMKQSDRKMVRNA